MKKSGTKSTSPFPQSEAELLKLFHELETYKIELESQNREFILAKEKAEEEKHKSEENLRILSWAVEQSPVSIIITDTEGQIEFVNPKFTKLTGYTYEEVLNKNPRILKTDFTSTEDYSTLWKTIKGGKEWSGEFCNKKKNGELYWESALISPIKNEKNQITHFVALKEDITKQKETERRIQSSIIEAEERERLYFSQELHDGIGPLLSAIKMYVQWLGMPNANIAPSEIVSDIEGFIEESSRTIHEIAFKLSPHILQKFGLAEAIKSYTTRLKESSVIDIKLDTKNLCRFDQVSETMAYRVICECINNTVRHANATEINILLSCYNRFLHVEYKDNGNGFDLDNVFSEHKGSGLYNMKSRILSLNGQIDIESSPGKGMKMSFQMSI
jgi:PAS domain S-box-containing protein